MARAEKETAEVAAAAKKKAEEEKKKPPSPPPPPPDKKEKKEPRYTPTAEETAHARTLRETVPDKKGVPGSADLIRGLRALNITGASFRGMKDIDKPSSPRNRLVLRALGIWRASRAAKEGKTFEQVCHKIFLASLPY